MEASDHMMFPLSSMFNLAGPDLLIILVVLLVLGLVAGLAIFLIVTFFSRPGRHDLAPPPLLVEERLRHLDELKARKTITDAECEEQLRRILGDA